LFFLCIDGFIVDLNKNLKGVDELDVEFDDFECDFLCM